MRTARYKGGWPTAISPVTSIECFGSIRKVKLRTAAGLGLFACVLVIQGIAITESYLWAAPLLGTAVVLVAPDVPLVPSLTAILLIRVLTDASLSSRALRHSGAFNLSGAIAILFVLLAAGLLMRRRRAVWPAALVGAWLVFWTLIAANSHGASLETAREGVREAAIVALGIIVYNSQGVLDLASVTRIIQIICVGAAAVALYQFATHSGLNIHGEVRANGTIEHPDGAAMLFAVATTVSVWRYFDFGRRRLDVVLTGVFGAATVVTFSLGGVAGLLVMLIMYGTLRPGSFRLKVGAYTIATVLMIGFLLTPLGAERVAQASSTNLASAQTRHVNSSLAWRLFKWQTLLPEWEREPIFGQGLGTTVTAEGTAENITAGLVPHNEYLRTLVETGVVGFVLTIVALVMVVRGLSRRRHLSGTANGAALGIAVVAGCLVNAAADNTFLYSTTAYPVAMIVAAVLSIRYVRSSRDSRRLLMNRSSLAI